jgi:hypothetical protein
MGKLTAFDAEDDEWFGRSVGRNGAAIVIGSYGDMVGARTPGSYISSPHLVMPNCRWIEVSYCRFPFLVRVRRFWR